ncbi:hypothetical protein F53441_5166 [Fusarium austroafricanum]|uniref:Fungal N-terminal domain-containing protein n=1 Tax=Fusarium austroafricanum TaxID=2364996 RepID=A0A8H4P8H5_9HYPO|nr:hypothetical protein F53441_5166 [Fusarium austroafricanum]
MDPLSITSASVGLAAAVYKCAIEVKWIVGTIADAADSLSDLAEEAQLIQGALQGVEDALQDNQEAISRYKVEEVFSIAVKGCRATLACIKQEFELLFNRSDWKARFMVLWKEDDMKKLLGRLDRKRESILLLLQLLSLIYADWENRESKLSTTEFDFDFELINTQAYRRALAQAQSQRSRLLPPRKEPQTPTQERNNDGLEPVEGLIDLSCEPSQQTTSMPSHTLSLYYKDLAGLEFIPINAHEGSADVGSRETFHSAKPINMRMMANLFPRPGDRSQKKSSPSWLPKVGQRQQHGQIELSSPIYIHTLRQARRSMAFQEGLSRDSNADTNSKVSHPSSQINARQRIPQHIVAKSPSALGMETIEEGDSCEAMFPFKKEEKKMNERLETTYPYNARLSPRPSKSAEDPWCPPFSDTSATRDYRTTKSQTSLLMEYFEGQRPRQNSPSSRVRPVSKKSKRVEGKHYPEAAEISRIDLASGIPSDDDGSPIGISKPPVSEIQLFTETQSILKLIAPINGRRLASPLMPDKNEGDIRKSRTPRPSTRKYVDDSKIQSNYPEYISGDDMRPRSRSPAKRPRPKQSQRTQANTGSTSSVDNSNLLKTVEDAIRRMILIPELSALERPITIRESRRPSSPGADASPALVTSTSADSPGPNCKEQENKKTKERSTLSHQSKMFEERDRKRSQRETGRKYRSLYNNSYYPDLDREGF